MVIEGTSKNDRFDINKKFLQNFHNSVLSKGQESKDNEGVITMKIVSVGTADDKHYLLPSYDPNTGQIISDRDKLIDKYRCRVAEFVSGVSTNKILLIIHLLLGPHQ